jgi:hypothetical protein
MRTFALLALATVAGCNGTTGSGLVTFTGRVGGPADVVADAPLAFHSGSGFDVTLIAATLHLGAVYLNATKPSSGGPEEPCVLPGVYVGQAFADVDVDLLSPALTTFTATAAGTANPVAVGDVWLTGGDINATEDPTPILQVSGTATRMADSWPFTATVTIGSNRAKPAPNPAMPGANPICRQRIVSPICGPNPTPNNSCPLLIGMLSDGGTLDMRIDPRPMFDSVDFTTLAPSGSASTLTIPDSSAGSGAELFGGLRSNSNESSDAVYTFTWTDKGP